MKKLEKILFKRVDNSALILFRVFFGLLVALECWGAIFTGWVRRILIEPEQTFHFIGLDFLQPLPGNMMYLYYIIMGLLGIFIMIGFYYKWSTAAFTLMWTATYLMQKSAYNNHYYLLILIAIFMLIVPAHRYWSYDTRKRHLSESYSMPQWVSIFIIAQLSIVYVFASVAKMYPDWLDLTVAETLMYYKRDYPIIGELLQQEAVLYVIAYFGLIFDLLVVPLLLWKRTRIPAFFLSLFFHLFNSMIFGIGIFPYLSLAFILFFFPPDVVRSKFKLKKPFYDKDEVIAPNYGPALMGCFAVWFFLQLALPLRHHFIKGNVLWTEEGHRMSWRMMLRVKRNIHQFKVVNLKTKKTEYIDTKDHLTPKQRRSLGKPDFIWQYARMIEEDYARRNIPVAVYADVKVSVNGRPYYQLIDPTLDLTKVEWDYFFHNEWIRPLPADFHGSVSASSEGE